MIKNILGKVILDSQGNVAGRVVDVDIDMVHAAIRRIVIRSGLTRKYFISPDDIVTIGDKIILRTNKTEIKDAETFNLFGIKRRLLVSQ